MSAERSAPLGQSVDPAKLTPLLRVTQQMVGVHPIHTEYPLLPGDVMTRHPDGTYTKQTGLGICGFTLSPAQADTLEPVEGVIVMDGHLP